MRRIVLWLAGTAVVTVLLIGYHTSTAGPTAATSATHGPQQPGVVTPPTAAAPPTTAPTKSGTTPTTTPTPTPATKDALVNGQVVDTRWGPVQVQVRIAGGRIAEVTALTFPDGNGRDAQINSYALPILRQQVLHAQSAQIDGVSGATVTSDGYRSSLQSALDAAKFPG
jgi:uncharacterized protein with FMN-binding domain